MDEVVWKQVIEPLSRDPLKLVGAVAVDCGVAICQALLAAFDEGLGACLSAFEPQRAQAAFGCRHTGCLSTLCWWAIRQNPGKLVVNVPDRPLESYILKDAMGIPGGAPTWLPPHSRQDVQDPAPLPWRQAEIKTLARAFGLPE